MTNSNIKILPGIAIAALISACTLTERGLSLTDLTEIANNGNHRFNVHFSVITNNPLATAANEEQMRKEIRILNTYFVSETGENLVEFIYQDTSLFSEILGSSCDLVTMSDDGVTYTSDEWELCPKVGDGVIRRRFEVA